MRSLLFPALLLCSFSVQAQTVCIGDSITQAKGATGFCERLGGINKGIGGQTAIQGLSRFDDDVLSYNPKRIFIGFGANDAYHARPIRAFRQEMCEMIRLSKHRKVILMTAPPRVADYQGQTMETLNEQELKYVKVVRRLGKRKNIEVIDLFRFIKRHNNVDGIHIDSLHFNDAGYELISAKIQRQLRRERKRHDK